jgi:hypothetical protein
MYHLVKIEENYNSKADVTFGMICIYTVSVRIAC